MIGALRQLDRQVDPYGLKILTAGNRSANRFILRQVNLHRGDEAP